MILPQKENGMDFVPRVEVLIFNLYRNKSEMTIFYIDLYNSPSHSRILIGSRL